MTTDRNNTAPAAFDWDAAVKEVLADTRAADANRAQRMEGVSESLKAAAGRNARRWATKNYGNGLGARKYTGLW